MSTFSIAGLNLELCWTGLSNRVSVSAFEQLKEKNHKELAGRQKF